MFVHHFSIITNCLSVCRSVSWLTSLLKADKCRDISQFRMRYLPESFLDIPGMFVHYFQIITNFLFVCQSYSLLISLLKIDQYRDISCPGWDIFLKIFWDIPGMFLHYFTIIANFLYVSQSFSWLTSSLK